MLRQITYCGLACLLGAIAWHHTFIHIWGRWFPAWHQTHLPLYDRLMTGETSYRHGPLVILVTLLLIHLQRRRPLLPPSPLGPSALDPSAPFHPHTLPGYLLLSLCLAVHLLSTWVGVGFTSGFALVGTILAGLLIAGGMPMLRRYGPAAALLVFAVPLPLVWIAQIQFSLKMFAASAAGALTHLLTASPVTIDGSRLILTGPGGTLQSMTVESACSGLRSLIALTWFGCALAVVCPLPARRRWAMIAMAAPLAIACNIARIAALIAGAQLLGVRAVADDTPLHALAGLGAFALALGALLAFEKLSARAADALRASGRARAIPATRSTSAAPTAASNSGHRTSNMLAYRTSHIALALLLIAAGASVGMGRASAAAPTAHAPLAAAATAWLAPHSLTIDRQTWRGSDLAIPDSLRATLGTPNILHRRYQPPRAIADPAAIDLIVVHHARSRQAIHPPTVCLEALGHRIVEQRDRTLTAADGQPVTVRELVTQHAGRRFVHLYVYRTAAGYTTSYLRQQIASIVSPGPAAMIRITAAGPGAADHAARAAAMLLP